jgi:hypothetical protein
MTADEAPEHIGPLAEFVALRTEIERRATIQWHVLALQITIAGAVFGFALSGGRGRSSCSSSLSRPT